MTRKRRVLAAAGLLVVGLAAVGLVLANALRSAERDERADFACNMRRPAGAGSYRVLKHDDVYACAYRADAGRVVTTVTVGRNP